MSAPTAAALAETLSPLTQNPSQAGVFCDIDGTLAPIVARPEDSAVGEDAVLLLDRLSRRYASVACVSGRSATEARRLVGLDSVAYVGAHGAEVMHAGEATPTLTPEFASWEGRVADFVRSRMAELGLGDLGVRLEDKGAIRALHWRGAPDEPAAETALEGVAHQAREAGLATHRGRKVLEIRPPVPVDKGQGIRVLVQHTPVRTALYGGDDVTDLDAFDALQNLVAHGGLDAAVCVGVRSPEGPTGIVERADLAVDGVPGFVEVLAVLAQEG